MRIELNGEPFEVADDTTALALIERVVGSTRGTAVAVDGTVVPRGEWPRTSLRPGQVVELITAVQGG
ncbi:sulfur carrier protein ThiS [Aeromicrobium sp.]|uniref:sulfur carrier protein ThiS n=1 Tax=Aeromicrobium sp. TaxID=1871063 RepID=UPI002FC59419